MINSPISSTIANSSRVKKSGAFHCAAALVAAFVALPRPASGMVTAAVAAIFNISRRLRPLSSPLASRPGVTSPAGSVIGLRESAVRILQVSFLELVGEVIARAPAESHNRPRRVLAGRADVAAAIDDEQVLDVVRLLKLVQHRSLRVRAHARRAEFVYGPSFCEHRT